MRIGGPGRGSTAYDVGTRLVIAALVIAGVTAWMFHSRDGSLSEAPVTRGGDVLVAEGLARRWNGPRQSWCGG